MYTWQNIITKFVLVKCQMANFFWPKAAKVNVSMVCNSRNTKQDLFFNQSNRLPSHKNSMYSNYWLGIVYLYEQPWCDQSQATVLSIESVMICIKGKVIKVEKPEKNNKKYFANKIHRNRAEVPMRLNTLVSLSGIWQGIPFPSSLY